MKLKTLAKLIGRLVSRIPILGPMAGLAVGQDALSNFAVNLNWANVDPTKYLYAGTRGISRGMSEAHLVWQTIPESLRATGPEAVAKHLSGFDWSHIVPFSAGGSNDASNGIFESAGLNRARGARAMTLKEIQVAHRVLRGKAFSAALSATASRMFAGAAVAAASGCVLATLGVRPRMATGDNRPRRDVAADCPRDGKVCRFRRGRVRFDGGHGIGVPAAHSFGDPLGDTPCRDGVLRYQP